MQLLIGYTVQISTKHYNCENTETSWCNSPALRQNEVPLSPVHHFNFSWFQKGENNFWHLFHKKIQKKTQWINHHTVWATYFWIQGWRQKTELLDVCKQWSWKRSLEVITSTYGCKAGLSLLLGDHFCIARRCCREKAHAVRTTSSYACQNI